MAATTTVILTATVAAIVHAGHEGYSYSCLTEVPEPGFVGVAYETVLPGSSIVHGVSCHRLITLSMHRMHAPGAL